MDKASVNYCQYCVGIRGHHLSGALKEKNQKRFKKIFSVLVDNIKDNTMNAKFFLKRKK